MFHEARDARKSGPLKRTRLIIEKTRGNTGIALAFVARHRLPAHSDHAENDVVGSGGRSLASSEQAGAHSRKQRA